MAKAESDLQAMLSIGMDPHQLPWYEPDLPEVPEPAKTILERYSRIPSDRVVGHVKNVFPYPCIGAFRFLDMSIPQSPVYHEVLHRLRSGETLLDVGCAIGQELRHLVFDGVPSENLYASDLRRDFFDMGYDLFADAETLRSPFIEADIFDDESALVRTLASKVDIINAASFFHLFSWDRQITIAKRMIGLLRERPGSLLIGRQVGCIDPPSPDDTENVLPHYRHDPGTWKRLWEQVARDTGTEWDVDAWVEDWEGADKIMKNYHGGLETFKLRFVVRRV
ncbi:hypothetical protein N7492_009528 [Penicillium capsulatum]|uniref:Methyltransferase domain-containing protein n=1 Tax=Penicillium capsulatum TaxID=69766 RepID=A0A9W9HUT8_9EURO|nr:hypothetical protein N7492_009528 [Penicillium capsulatum]KAJ6106917.1 hypothetical protein N7512_010434 [Penicillium capsulatum]